MEKRCFKCLRDLPLSEFYRHHMMADGHLSKCKDCTRADVKRHRVENADRVREYDRGRSSRPQRVELRERVGREWRAKHPDRARAEGAAARAVRQGLLPKPNGCEGCGREGGRLEKHHPDYERQLVVVWLCKPCHAIADKIRRRLEEASNAQTSVLR